MTKFTQAALEKTTKTLLASGAKFNTAMQEHICNIASFIYQTDDKGNMNGNSTPASDLINQIGRRADRESIKAWFLKHCDLKWMGATEAKGKKQAQSAKFKKGDKGETFVFNLEAATADLWFADATNARDADAPRTTKFDLPAQLSRLLTKIEDIKDSMIEGDVLPDYLVNGITALMLQYETYMKGKALEAEQAKAKLEAEKPSEIVKPETVAKTPKGKRAPSGGNRKPKEETPANEQLAA